MSVVHKIQNYQGYLENVNVTSYSELQWLCMMANWPTYPWGHQCIKAAQLPICGLAIARPLFISLLLHLNVITKGFCGGAEIKF